MWNVHQNTDLPTNIEDESKESNVFIRTPDGKYSYNISLSNNDEIVRFVSIVKELEGEIYLTGFEQGHLYTVSARSILGVLYASVLDNLKCISSINIMGDIARFITECENGEDCIPADDLNTET